MYCNSFSKILGVIVLLAVAGLFLGGGPFLAVILGVAGFAILGVVLLLGVVLFFAFRGSKKKAAAEPNQEKKTDASINEVLNKGKRNVLELRTMTVKVKNLQVRGVSEEICNTADSILKVLKEQPEDLRSVRQFLNYYLPTLGSILTKYVRLEQSGVPNAEITEKTITHLEEINLAMQKQYENLFADDILDLSVEMEALTQACKRDGLLGEEFDLKNGNETIKLAL